MNYHMVFNSKQSATIAPALEGFDRCLEQRGEAKGGEEVKTAMMILTALAYSRF